VNKTIKKKAETFLFKIGYGKIKKIKEINEGVNSNVYKLDLNEKSFILKIYKDKRRIKREKLFYNYLLNIKNCKITIPLYFNVNLKIAIFKFISGKKITKVKNSHIKEMSIFLNEINKKNSFKLPIAVDGIKNIIDHIKFCSLKIDEIKKIKIDSNLKKECIYFLNKKIIPKFNQLNKNFLKRNFLNKKKNKLLRNQMVVSPSDFGLHNIIKSNKNFFFLDFEYAGLDDPIKLICDFFSQPDQSLSSSQKELFIKKLNFIKYNKLKPFIKVFLPFYKLKWCCIMLNKFKNDKKFNNQKILKQNNQILKSQLIKTRDYFNKNFKEFNNGN
jgi:hypothetical protein